MGKRKAPPCPKGCKNRFGRPYKMHRLYLRKGNSMKTYAWVCLRCGFIQINTTKPQILNSQHVEK